MGGAVLLEAVILQCAARRMLAKRLHAEMRRTELRKAEARTRLAAREEEERVKREAKAAARVRQRAEAEAARAARVVSRTEAGLEAAVVVAVMLADVVAGMAAGAAMEVASAAAVGRQHSDQAPVCEVGVQAVPEMRRLVVEVEPDVAEADAETQTDNNIAMVDAVSQCTLADQTEPPGFEITVGRLLHPAQARAVARAEEAAASIERVQAEVEARAARYATRPMRTGGRQLKKEAARRKAAASGMDVLSWSEAQERSKAVRALIEQRLDAGHERWMLQQKGGVQSGGEVAPRTFLQAALAAGIEAVVPES